jgi:hypothetical protein
VIWPKLAMYDTRRMGVASSRALLEFVLIDLDLEMTFLNVADSSTIAETVQRNRHNARRAYDAVLHWLPKLVLTTSEGQAIEKKLSILRLRMEAAGERF